MIGLSIVPGSFEKMKGEIKLKNRSSSKIKGKGKRKMIGWIVALIVVVVLFGIGALFCAPWSPVRKAREEAKNIQIKTADLCMSNEGANVGEEKN